MLAYVPIRPSSPLSLVVFLLLAPSKKPVVFIHHPISTPFELTVYSLDAAEYAEQLCASVGVDLPSSTEGAVSTECETATEQASMTDIMASATISLASQPTIGIMNATASKPHSTPVATFIGGAATLNKGSWVLGALGALLAGAL